MDNENRRNLPLTLPGAIVIAAVIVSGSLLYKFGPPGPEVPAVKESAQAQSQRQASLELEEAVLPSAGILLPVVWGDLGKKLVETGAIDGLKMAALYEQRGQWSQEYKKLIEADDNGQIRLTRDNSGYILNLLWALGLANKNPILETGEMSDPKYGGAGKFASTGGWALAKGSGMEHYSRHKLIPLSRDQQALVEKVSKGVYRPCCGNSTHFPDCNHGMAMLALLELMASQGASEPQMWKTALAVNSYWFPDTYMSMAMYMKSLGTQWADADPAEMLGANYSSSSGARRISQMFDSASSLGGNGCGVGGGAQLPVQTPKQQTGCGI